MTKTRIITLIAAIVAAIILLQTLYFKFTGHADSVAIFSALGAEPFGRIASGVMELIAGLLLLVPKTSKIGAALALVIMFGAIASHLFLLGISVNGDGGVLFGMAVVVALCSSIVLALKE